MRELSDSADAISLLYAALHAVGVHAAVSQHSGKMDSGICKDAVKRSVLLLRLLPKDDLAERGVVTNHLAMTLQGQLNRCSRCSQV
jgi:hypothetical protein